MTFTFSQLCYITGAGASIPKVRRRPADDEWCSAARSALLVLDTTTTLVPRGTPMERKVITLRTVINDNYKRGEVAFSAA
ncbi:hypothetical protein J6590_033731 [Homalodisca vitripennis]|nr:hypothetical protein J6590_033731 [Homalodisca vitripennis]